MEVKNISEFFDGLRVAVGDEIVEGVGTYQDWSLANALRNVFNTGLGPSTYTLDKPNGNIISPSITYAPAYGYILFKAAIILTGGETAGSVRTPHLSTSVPSRAQQERVINLRAMLARFGDKEDLYNGAPPLEDVYLGIVAGRDPITGIKTALRHNLQIDPDDEANLATA